MAYADRRRVATFDLKTADMAAVVADDADLFSIIIPANKEVNIYAFKGVVRLASGASDKIELCLADNTVLSTIAIDATGIVSGSGTFPIRVTALTADTALKLRADGASDATTDLTLEVHMDEPGT